MNALDGITVLDLTRLLPGGATSAALRAEGATVIKIEEPVGGDYARTMAPLIDGVGAVFRETDGGKQSVAINLKHPLGCAALLAMVPRADVLLEGNRPGTMKRLGLDYETLAEHNPRLIYASISGYGQTSAMAGKAGHDINYIAMAGLLGVNTTRSGVPVIPGVQLADLAGGTMQAVNRILLALLERSHTGRGKFLDISMTAGVGALMTIPQAWQKALGRQMRGCNELLTGRYACYNVYQSSDGKWFAVGALEPKFWHALCDALNCEELAAEQFAGEPRQTAIMAAIAELFASKTALEWREFWAVRDACVTPVLSVAETVLRDCREPPRLGQHTREVLMALGYSELQIDELAAGGVIRCA